MHYLLEDFKGYGIECVPSMSFAAIGKEGVKWKGTTAESAVRILISIKSEGTESRLLVVHITK